MTDDDGNLMDRREKIEFPLEESKEDVLKSHADVVHLVARAPNGEQLGGSGLEIEYLGAKFVITSAQNVAIKSMRRSDQPMRPRNNLTGFKKRMGVNNKYEWLLEFKHVATHPLYDGKSSCGFDIAVMKVDKQTRGTLNNNGNFVSDYDFSAPELGQVAEGKKIRLHGYPQEKECYLYQSSGEIVHVLEQYTEGIKGTLMLYDADTTE